MRVACVLFCACAVVALTRRADAQAAQDAPPRRATIQTQVVGFELTGPKPFEKLFIDDLDTVVTAGGARLIPLLRLLDAFQIEAHADADGIVTFVPDGVAKVTVDIVGKAIRTSDAAEPVDLVIGVSDITTKDEIYLDPAIAARTVGLSIEWDEPGFSMQSVEESLHNPSSYASLSAQVYVGRAEWPKSARYGAGRPAD